MRQTLTKILILSFILSLLLPSGKIGLFDFLNFQAPAEASQANTISASPQIVKVVSVTSPLKVETRSISLVSNCSASELTKNNLIQDTGKINLNEPASCFTLTAPVSEKAAKINLAVEFLSQLKQQIVFVTHKVLISGPVLNQHTPAEQIPVLPSVVALVSAMMFISEKRIKVKTSNLKVTIKKTLSLEQLQVMRC